MAEYKPSFYLGVVEDRYDPLMLGRVRVRILGLHTHKKSDLPTEDLPWAYKIQPTTSGAMTGIGHAPVGVMEGTWVAIQFIDPDKQMPFVVGTIGGIPQEKNPQLESFEFINQDSSVATPTSQTDQAIADAKTEPEALQIQTEDESIRSASEFTASDDIIESLKKYERFHAEPFDNGVSVVVGYGSTYYLDGSEVNITSKVVDEELATEMLKDKVDKELSTAVGLLVRVPITQSMFDALIHLSYNVGTTTLRSYISSSGLNSLDYAGAAEFLINYNVSEGTASEASLRQRRKFEKDWFLRDGIPREDGTVDETPQSAAAEAANETSTPVTAAGEDVETWKRTAYLGEVGFRDPSNIYPINTLVNEPDTNRLARHQDTKGTIVYLKETAEHKGIETANDGPSWDQTPTPYNATYPFNNVWQSESGHVTEYDDTPGRERIHQYHRTGTFSEVDHNGTRVNRIVGDDFLILERDGYVHVVGNLYVTVDGAKRLKISDTLDVEVDGLTNIHIHDTCNLDISDDFNISVGGNFNLDIGGNQSINTVGTVNEKSGGIRTLESGGKTSIKAGAMVAIDGSTTNTQQGAASSASVTTIDYLDSIGGTPVTPPVLSVNTRAEDAAANYESPDEGTVEDFTAYKAARISDGTATASTFSSEATVSDEYTPSENKSEETEVDQVGDGTSDFDYAKKFSSYYTLGDLTQNGTRKLVDQVGLSKAQIYNNLRALAVNVMDPIKMKYPSVKINSGFRRPGDVANSSKTSQHYKGQAVDLKFSNLTREQLYDRVLELQQMVPYDQMILEYSSGSTGWIHISFSSSGNRKQHFTMNNHKRVSSVGTFVKVG